MNLITDSFTAVSLDVDETVPDNCGCEVSAYLAELKADKASELYPDSVVIGCDTVVKINGQILGKPRNSEECRKFLSMLSGKSHTVTTSCCIAGFGNKILFSENTSVTFRKLSEGDIKWYISTGEPFDKAGGYGIQGKGALFVQNISGDFFNVVGLPVSALNQQLKIFMKSIKEKNMNTTAFKNADILIPVNSVDMEKWAVIACDQYTGEPEYWDRVRENAGSSPSSLNLILPELYLENNDVPERIENIRKTMEKYLNDGIFKEYKDAMIYVERVQSNGIVRKGIIGAIDLEEYDFSKGSTSQVRATEATVIERIPPRIKVRQGAPLELPHIMILIDDPDNTVIESVDSSGLEKLYDTKLMENGGSIKGYLLDEQSQEKINSALCQLAEESVLESGKNDILLFAMGDGNHSLATAKTYYEQLKKENPDMDFSNHPARYALAEIVNLYSDALKFEAIYRLVYDVDCDKLIADMTESLALSQESAEQWVEIVCGGKSDRLYIHNTSSTLSVGSLQNYLDKYLAENGGKIDYIHGIENVKSLAQKHNGIAFILPDMDKLQLFPTVISDGSLPRKTFSMGHADDKRFYIEARKISE